MSLPPIPEDASPEARAAMEFHDEGLAGSEFRLHRYRELARAVDGEGPECAFCRKRGINCGRFAQPFRAGFAHIGCESDHFRELERDSPADATP